MQVGFPTQTLNSQDVGYYNANVRVIISSSLLTGSSTNAIITLKGPSTELTGLTSIYVGHAASSGDAWDFDGGQKQVLFSGLGTLTLAVNEVVSSDSVDFHIDQTKNLIVSFHIENDGAKDNMKLATTTDVTSCYKGGADESGTTNVSGYTAYANYHFSVVSVLGDKFIPPYSFGWLIV
jgi:hypothetical protein